jgi:hypothetical protein
LPYRTNFFVDYADEPRRAEAVVISELSEAHSAALCTPGLHADRKMHILMIPAAPTLNRFNKHTFCGCDTYGYIHYSLWTNVEERLGRAKARNLFCKQCVASMDWRNRRGEFSERIMMRMLAVVG